MNTFVPIADLSLPSPDGALAPEVEEKYQRLQRILTDLGSVVIAFSGGVDSTFLLKAATETLGPSRVLAVIAVSESYPEREKEEAIHLAEEIGAPYRLIHTKELSDPRYANNPSNRCFYCKDELFSRLSEIAREMGYAHVLDGTNQDDVGDYRPGIAAAKRLGVRSPLLEAGLTKADIRALSRHMGLPTWNKPAAACLASRIPYNTRITSEMLRQVDAAEQCLFDLGFRIVRVRHHGEIARIEVAPSEIARLAQPEVREVVVSRLKALGYKYVTLDLTGYRTGSLNENLR